MRWSVPDAALAVRGWSDHTLLAAAIFGEARGEPDAGKLAVAGVVLNRVGHPTWWGHDIETVLLADVNGDGLPEQFSCFRPIANGGQLEVVMRPLHAEPAEVWDRCATIAAQAMLGAPAPFPTATHYVATSIAPPSWTHALQRLGVLGHHVFFAAPEK